MTNKVNGEELLNKLRDLYNRYIILPECGADAMALWTLFTHCIDAFYVAPYLAILSPEKRCGKTRVLELLEHTTRNGKLVGNITAAMVYRSPCDKITMLIDEGDTFIVQGNSANEGMRGILNVAHIRRGRVIRGDSETYDPKEFSPFGAKAIAMIGNLPDTVADRSIKIRMRRKKPSETVERYRIDRMQHAETLKHDCAQWAKENLQQLRQADPTMPKGLHDRAEDNWRHLIAIADECGGAWRERARYVAKTLEGVGEQRQASTPGEQLLADIYEVFEDKAFMGSSELLEHLQAYDRWCVMNDHGHPLTSTALGRMLRAFEITSKRVRDANGKQYRGFAREDFEDAWSRYAVVQEAAA